MRRVAPAACAILATSRMATNRADPRKPAARKPTRSKAALPPETKVYEHPEARKGEFEDSIWEHLAGTKSEAFEAGEHGQIAVKVIDDRGNELVVVRKLDEVEQ